MTGLEAQAILMRPTFDDLCLDAKRALERCEELRQAEQWAREREFSTNGTYPRPFVLELDQQEVERKLTFLQNCGFKEEC